MVDEEKKPAPEADKPEGQEIGKITHYFGKIGVGIIELTSDLAVGDNIAIKGATSDIEQPVDSLELDHQSVQTAKTGDSVGIKVKDKVREGDVVYKV